MINLLESLPVGRTEIVAENLPTVKPALGRMRRGNFHATLGNCVRYIFATRIFIQGVFNMSHLARRNFLETLSAASTAGLLPARTSGATETAAALRIFKLGAISDGFSDDLEKALKLMKGYGLEGDAQPAQPVMP
jgi:hypothetical protein